jgi:hypothetical protein
MPNGILGGSWSHHQSEQMSSQGMLLTSHPIENMNPPAILGESEAAGGEVPLTLDAVLIYEDLSTGLRAKWMLECVARLVPGTSHFNLAMWRFDLLRESTMHETALQEASTAVIVLLSAHGARNVPEAVTIWLEQWLGQKSEDPCALIISLDENSRDSASAIQMISSLQSGARATDVALFPHFSGTPACDGGPTVEDIQRAHTVVATLNDIQRRPELYSRWGINE